MPTKKQVYAGTNPESRTTHSYTSKPSPEEVKELQSDIFNRERKRQHADIAQPPKPEFIELPAIGKSGAIDYPGGFPKNFSKTVRQELLLKQGELKDEDILQPFGGNSTESKRFGGDKIDINAKTKPTVVGDSSTDKPYEELMRQRHGKKYKLIILDPPWGEAQSKRLYHTPHHRFGQSLEVASKYVEPGGRIIITDTRKHFTPPGYQEEKQIIYDTRQLKSTPRRIQTFRRIK
jgi:hypothetical protein